jgi:ABC-type uncharacterized transport system permease subunit
MEEALVGRLTALNLMAAIALATARLLASRLLWKQGVKHYSAASADTLLRRFGVSPF